MIECTEIIDDNRVVNTVPDDYGPALDTIVNKIKTAQARAIRAVNFLACYGIQGDWPDHL